MDQDTNMCGFLHVLRHKRNPKSLSVRFCLLYILICHTKSLQLALLKTLSDNIHVLIILFVLYANTPLTYWSNRCVARILEYNSKGISKGQHPLILRSRTALHTCSNCTFLLSSSNCYFCFWFYILHRGSGFCPNTFNTEYNTNYKFLWFSFLF